MTSAPTSYPCPYCGAVASSATGCPSCRRGPDADAIEVIRLDTEIAGIHQRLHAARIQVSVVEKQLSDAMIRRNTAAHRIGSAVRAATAPPPPPPRFPSQAPTTRAPATHAPATQAAASPAEPRLSTLTVQNVLFALGGLLLVVAAAVFTAVAWAQVGVAGRAALLAAATAAVLAVPPFAVRRGLTAAAETLAAVGLLMILLDGYAAWAVGFLGVREADPQVYAAAVAAVTAATALGYSKLVGLPGARIAALVVAQPVLPLLAAATDTGATGWSLTLTGVTVLNVAALRLRRDRFTVDAMSIVAYVCGAIATASAGIAALAGVALADSAAEGAAAGGALMLIAAVLVGAAVLAGHRVAQAIAGGLLVVATGVAAGGWLLLLDDRTPELRIAVVALVVAALVAAVRPRLPEPVGHGPRIGALLVAAVPALGVAAAVVAAALASAEAARPVLAAPLTSTVSGSSWDLPVAAVTVLCAYALVLPSRRRTDLALTALAVVALLAPAAFRLPWWTAAIFAVAVAAVALAFAARTRSELLLAVRLTGAAVMTFYAVVVSLGHPAVGAGICVAVAGAGLGTAFAVRAGARSADVGAVAFVVGMFAVPPAVWLGLLALGISPTVRVRVFLGVVVLIGAARLVTVRRLPGYAPHALAVAVTMASVLPLVAFAGRDPVSLYAAAALALLAANAGVGMGAGAAAAGAVIACGAVVPLLVLLALTGLDLAVVLIEPFAALDRAWSGIVPDTSPVAWSTVAALLISAVAAWLVTRTRRGLLGAAPLVAVVIPLALAAGGAPWPAVPVADLIVGLAGLVFLARTSAFGTWTAPAAALSGVLAAAGVAGSTPVRGAMMAAFALVVVASAAIGVAGRAEIVRIAGWMAGCVSVTVLAFTGAYATGLGSRYATFAVLAAAAVAAALEWVLARRRPREAPAVAAVAHSTALVALLISGTYGRGAVVAVLWATVLAVRALRPAHRLAYTIAAAASVLLGWWLLLASWQVETVEVYTVPAAVLALGAGWFARLGRPDLPSWTAYGPALAAGFLPTFAVITNSAAGDPQYGRRLLLGAAGLTVLVLGAWARLQAPVVIGSGVLGMVALYELIQFWDLLPRWVPLAVGGLLLVGIATTMEQRRRDLLRLRAAVSRMN